MVFFRPQVRHSPTHGTGTNQSQYTYMIATKMAGKRAMYVLDEYKKRACLSTGFCVSTKQPTLATC